MVLLTLLFSMRNWGPHFHHYFLALLGYLGSRGTSRVAALLRAFCLGAFINGLCFWGNPLSIPMWNYGNGWYPPEGSIRAGAQGLEGASVLWTAAEAVRAAVSTNGTQIYGSGGVRLSWALDRDVSRNCSLPVELNESEDGSVFVV